MPTLSATLSRARPLSAVALVAPAVVSPPASLPSEVPWETVRVAVPDPVAVPARNGRPDPAVFQITGMTRTPYGRPQVVIDGQDVTFARGVPVRIVQWSRSMPFGDEAMVLQFPQYTAIEPNPSWMTPGSPAYVYLVRPDGTRAPTPLWEGYVASVSVAAGDWSTAGLTVECAGLLRYAAQALRQPPFTGAVSQDIGAAIKSALDGVVSRPYGPMPLTTTGVPTLNKGARSDTVAGYVTDLLAQSLGADGFGWTVLAQPGGTPYLHRLNDAAPEQVTATIGEPGLVLDGLHADPLMSPNVIYGVATDPVSGCLFTNLVWSGQAASNPPPYPFSNPSNTISVGGHDTDAETDTGDGVTVMERRLQETGYIGTVNGTYSSADADSVRRFQQAAGIQVDGVVGPQTWSALWAYTRTSDLSAVFYRPFAIDPKVDPYVYAADGSILGGNPSYDPTILRVERFVSFGTATKAEALRSAQAMLAQGRLPDVTGRVTLTTDPPQMNRREIRAGQKIRLRGYGGVAAGVIATITQVTIDSEGGAALLVDTRARDLVAATAIAERDRSNTSPAWRTSTTSRRSSQDPDTKVAYDCSSAQGIVENLQVFSGLWSVIRIPLVDRGTVAAVRFAAGAPLRSVEWERLDPVPGGRKFALGLFAKPITASALASVVGNPLTAGSDRWTESYQTLVEGYGVLAAWGTGDDGAGFSPGQEANDDSVTGRLLDLGSWEFQGDPAHVPYVWVAAYSESSCFLAGRIYLSAEG